MKDASISGVRTFIYYKENFQLFIANYSIFKICYNKDVFTKLNHKNKIINII